MATKSFIKTIGEKGLLADYNTEGKKLQTELTAGDNITIDSNTISSDQVFVAKYGITTYAEVKAAFDAGKICTVFRNDRYYYIKQIFPESITFASSTASSVLYSLTVNSTDRWSSYTGHLQSKLTFDDAPKAGSKNPVTSDGIKTAIDTRLPVLNISPTLTSLDFNDFTSTGFHYCSGFNEGFTSYSNAPISLSKTISWRLEVINRRARIEQILVLVGDADSTEKNYKRHRSTNNVWSDWQTFVFESDLSSYEQVANKVDAWQNTPDDTHYPSERLVKTALDSRIPAPTSTTGTQVLKCINGVVQWVTE